MLKCEPPPVGCLVPLAGADPALKAAAPYPAPADSAGVDSDLAQWAALRVPFELRPSHCGHRPFKLAWGLAGAAGFGPGAPTEWQRVRTLARNLKGASPKPAASASGDGWQGNLGAGGQLQL